MTRPRTNDPNEAEGGLRGPDKQQGRLRDVQGGTYETAGPTLAPSEQSSERTGHQRRQPGADVRQGVPARETAPHPQQEPDLPEGLLRPRKGPYDRNLGREGEASEAPRPKR